MITHSKVVSPLGIHSWKKSDFFWFCKIEGRGASEGWEIEFLKSEVVKFWKQNSNYWVKTMHNSSLNFWNWWTVVIIWANLAIGITQNSKFSKFDLTPKFHLFFWLKNTPYFNFKFYNDRIICIWFLHLLRPLSLRFCKIGRNYLSSIIV